jgi:pimeloyl-ACP methyl ester carboxylesterase
MKGVPANAACGADSRSEPFLELLGCVTRHEVAMSRRKKILLSILGVLLFIVFVLPYLLPLNGPEAVDPATLIDPNGAFVQAGDTQMYYQKAGSGDVPIVLVHGFGASSFSWRDNLNPIAATGFTVYAPDMRGFGLSDKGWDKSMSQDAQADRLKAFMDAQGIDRAVLAGNSMGGGIVTNFALRYPDRVRGLVLVDPAIYGGMNSGLASTLVSLPGIQRWGQHLVRFILANDDRNASTIQSAWFDPAKVMPDALSGYRRALQTPDWDMGLLALIRDGMSNNLGSRLKELNMPTLIVWGEHDSWISPTNAPKLNQDITGSKLEIIKNAGHVPHEEQPAKFNQLLIEFTNGLK